MINSKLATVNLHTSGRHFRCIYCMRVRQHLPEDLTYYVIGYGFCEWCVQWIPIEGGDRLGTARELKERSRCGGCSRKRRKKSSGVL
jgi:hypothetical protein